MNNSDNIKFSTVFIELDALLDTRLAVLASMGHSVLDSVLNETYFIRLIDRFENIDNQEFSERYKNRDKSILKDAVITPMSDLLVEFAIKTNKLIISSPFHNKPRIIVNTYPYVFNDDEAVSMIEALVVITNELADIKLVHMKYDEITPLYIKNEVDYFILYDYTNWLEIHSVNKLLEKTTCPGVELLGPSIYFKQLPKLTNNKIDPFEAMEELTAPFIALNLLPIINFSAQYK